MYFPHAFAISVTAKRAASADETQKDICGGSDAIASAMPITKTISAPCQLSQRRATSRWESGTVGGMPAVVVMGLSDRGAVGFG